MRGNIASTSSYILLSMYTVAVCAVFLTATPLHARAQEVTSLSQNLTQGDENAEVTLLQTWLATDKDIYPEGAVVGAYGEATTRAVQRYQRQLGLIFLDANGKSPYGNIDSITRADLNVHFSENHNNIAFVEGSYDDAARLGNDQFVQLSENIFTLSSPTVGRVEAWVYLNKVPQNNLPIFTNSDGYTLGVTADGTVYGVSSSGGLATGSTLHIEAQQWHHIAILFTTSEGVVVINNDETEIVSLMQEPHTSTVGGFFESIVSAIRSVFLPSYTPKYTDTVEDTKANLTSKQSHGIFTDALSFAKRIFGIQTEPADEQPTTAVVGVGEQATEPLARIKATAPELIVALRPKTTTSPTDLNATSTLGLTGALPTASSTLSIATSTIATATSTATTTDTVATTSDSTTSGITKSGGSANSSDVPTITLKGSTKVSIMVGTTYTDPGVTAYDNEDGDLSSEVEIGGSTVDHNSVGLYKITYNVTDSSGKKATEVTRSITVEPPPSYSLESQIPEYELAPAGQNVSYTVSGEAATSDPKITSVNISPLHVYVGDTQTFTVNVSSDVGIASVTAETELDSTTLNQTLTKKNSSTYEVSWVVYDTHTQTYRTTFTVTNLNGDETETTMAWSDPCSGVVQGSNSSLSANCAVSTMSGLDGASLTIPGGTTLTINSGGTWVWNPGTSITITGSIVKGTGGQLKKGYLFYSGSTNETADVSAMVFDASSTKTGYVRVNQYAQSFYESFYEMMYFCLDGETPILMADGTEKAIKDVVLGDLVIGQDKHGHRKVNVVTRLFHHSPEEHNQQAYDTLKINGSLVIMSEHMINSTRGWISAGEVRVGDVLIGAQGEVPVTSVTKGPSLPYVYNLTTYPDHTYFAGGFMVHNIKQQCDFC